MKKQCIFALLVGLLAGSAMAADNVMATSLFYAGAYGGYGHMDGAYGQDGNFTQGRAALGVQPLQFAKTNLGVELGMQSGNTLRLAASEALIDATGGMQPQATLKSFVDMLLTVKGKFAADKPFSYFVKAGGAYRQLQLNDRTSSEDSVQSISPEVQLGLGYDLSKQISLVAFYQGIYSGSDADVQVNSSGDTTISRIPSQQAGFLGVEYRF